MVNVAVVDARSGRRSTPQRVVAFWADVREVVHSYRVAEDFDDRLIVPAWWHVHVADIAWDMRVARVPVRELREQAFTKFI